MSCGLRQSCAEVFLQLLVIGLTNGSVIALNAIGVTLVYGIVRTLNFAHGDLFAMVTVLVTGLIMALGLGPASSPLALLAGLGLVAASAVAAGTLLNIGIERAAFRPFRGRSRLGPLIATVGLSFIIYQAALLWQRSRWIVGEHRSVPGLPEVPRGSIPALLPTADLAGLLGLNVRLRVDDLIVVALAVGLAWLTAWFLASTRAGRALRATAQDPTAAALCGVDSGRMMRLAFALGGGLAGAAALTFSLFYGHPFGSHGLHSGLVAFVAAVFGGIGRPRGALLAGLALGVVAAFSDYLLAAQWTPALLLAGLIGALLLRPGGLGGAAPEPLAAGATTADLALAQRRRGEPRRSRLLVGLVLGLGLAYPLLDSWLGLGRQFVATALVVFALLAVGLNLVLGMGGLLDLGYAAFFGLGGYAAGLLTTPGSRLVAVLGPALPARPEAGLVLAVAAGVAGLLGALMGLITRRLRGEELAIATLALGQVVTIALVNLDSWTGGDRGLTAIPRPRVLGQPLAAGWQVYVLAIGMLALAALASRRLARSRTGRAWAALGDDEPAAQSCGISPLWGRVSVLGLGSAVAGAAGALYAMAFGYIDPGQAELRVSAMVLAMVVVGGAGSVGGAILGALLIGGYDLLLIPELGALLDRVGQQVGVTPALDVRGLSFFSFGLALYLTVLLRERRAADPAR